MTKITLGTRNTNITMDIKINQDLFTCLIPALLAALPAFLDAFFKCIGGDGSSDKFKPGTRPRCG
ncbi:MAG TPA: hypothetical protein VNA25_20805 [Phycisphaerae bacterium]|nr:hypothetical protein [Phycisphaerae bacterium]